MVTTFLEIKKAPADAGGRSKASVCRRSLAGIEGSNPVGEWMSASCVCCALSDHWPRGVLPTVWCV